MPVAPDPSLIPGPLDGFLTVGSIIGSIIGGIILGYRGYNRTPKRVETATLAGAVIDSSSVQLLLGRFDALIVRLDTLIASQGRLTEFLSRDVKLREAEAEEEAQQERVDDAVAKAMKKILRDNPAAPMPKVRRDDPAE